MNSTTDALLQAPRSRTKTGPEARGEGLGTRRGDAESATPALAQVHELFPVPGDRTEGMPPSGTHSGDDAGGATFHRDSARSRRSKNGKPQDRKARHPKPKKERLTGSELGMATAEYAIATLAAVGFAGLLVVILRSEEVRGFLLNLIRSALSLP